MGSHMNFNFKNMIPGGNNNGGILSVNYSPLTRQTSVYSLTFDELQNTLGGDGKDFGSMNMDEFIKNIWTAEEAQAMVSTFGMPDGGTSGGGTLQRQGSLTLPRTLSQKTVDQVWRDMYRESGGKDGIGNPGLNLLQKQQTLGEITLEEFLLKAGVVREDSEPAAQLNNSGFYGELARSNNNSSINLGSPYAGHSNGVRMNRILENNNQITQQSPNPVMNVNGVRSLHQQQQQLFPNQSNVPFASSMQLGNNVESANPRVSSILGISDTKVSNGFEHSSQGGLPNRGGKGMVGLGAAGVTGAMASPGNQLSSDGLGKSNGDTSSLSPVPYVFNGGFRGRKSGAVEKVVERRQRRMIKNRESAARSRARKQAYTVELEAEVTKLKEENKALKKRQAEALEMQKNQVLDIINQQHGGPKRGPKKPWLRRTQTGPW
ncbi:hypothetical protein AAC387_Pa11g1522 [Persea americana]